MISAHPLTPFPITSSLDPCCHTENSAIAMNLEKHPLIFYAQLSPLSRPAYPVMMEIPLATTDGALTVQDTKCFTCIT